MMMIASTLGHTQNFGIEFKREREKKKTENKKQEKKQIDSVCV